MNGKGHVTVVGSGIAGSMVSYALINAGYRVTLLERGPRVSALQSETIIAKGSFQKAGMPFLRPLYRERPGRRRYDRWLPGVIGGLAEFYQAVSLRFRHEDFALWPIGSDHLAPHYESAEKLMDVAVPQFEFPPITAQIAAAVRNRGMVPQSHPLAIKMASCVQCRNCNQIPCTFEARFSAARFMERNLAGRELFEQRQGEVLHVEETPTGTQLSLLGGERLSTDGAVLCAGAIDSAAILLRSGLGGEAAGRNLMLHGLATVQGLFRKAISRGRGFEKYISVFDHYLDDTGVRGIIQQDQLPAIEHLREKLPSLLYRLVDRAYDHLAKLLIIVADEARSQNRVELAPDGKLSVVHDFSDRDRTRMAFLAARAGEILKAAGAIQVHTVENKSIFHACGTTRMGTDPRSSVTGLDGRIHGTRRLFVGDAGTFCSSGGVNPSLTIAANALRIGEGLTL